MLLSCCGDLLHSFYTNSPIVFLFDMHLVYIFCVMAFSVLSSFHREGFSSSLDISERGEKRESTVHEQFCKFMFQLRYSKAAASAPNITNDIKTVTERAPGLVYIKSQ